MGKSAVSLRETVVNSFAYQEAVYVNIKHIIKATSKEVTLEDGTSLFISRGQQSIVRDRLSEL